jgi:uncharacterized membrane protein
MLYIKETLPLISTSNRLTKGIFLSESLYFIGSFMTSFNTNMSPASESFNYNQALIFSSNTTFACYSLKWKSNLFSYILTTFSLSTSSNDY